MKRSDGRNLATHTGSLPRTEALTELLVPQNRGEEINEQALRSEWEKLKSLQAGAALVSESVSW